MANGGEVMNLPARSSTVMPLLQLAGLSKTFGGTRALDDVSLDVRSGEIHALVGHNGSGKSTLIKVLSGFHRPDSGAAFSFLGEEVDLDSLQKSPEGTAEGKRMSFVHQDLGLILEMNVIDNLALHAGFATRFGIVDRRQQERRVRDLLAPFGIQVDPYALLSSLTQLERTLIAIAAALDGWNSSNGVLVLDEPTSSLPAHHSRSLLTELRNLRDSGAGILFVSHRLDEVFAVADRVTVFRNGRHITTAECASLSKSQLIHLMLGDEGAIAEAQGVKDRQVGPRAVFSVSKLSGGGVRDLSFSLKAGEVLGFAGLPGSGASDVPRLLTDRRRDIDSGTIEDGAGKVHKASGWKDANTIALVPNDRNRYGSIAAMSVSDNLTLSVIGQIGRYGFINSAREAKVTDVWVDRLSVVCSSTDSPMSTLSGGNQQRVLLARAMARQPKVLALCEPTEGVDVGASHTIYSYIREQVESGLSAIVTSVDADDFVALCDRVLVMNQGVVVKEMAGAEITERNLIHAIEGVDGRS